MTILKELLLKDFLKYLSELKPSLQIEKKKCTIINSLLFLRNKIKYIISQNRDTKRNNNLRQRKMRY